MKYRPYPHEALKKAVAGALGPAQLDFTKLMGDEPFSPVDDLSGPPGRLQVGRLALVAALGMGIRKGIFSRGEVEHLQRVAAKGNQPAMLALRAMQAQNPLMRTKALGVLLWRIKYGGQQGPEVFLAAAHLLGEELRSKRLKDRHGVSAGYIAVMQCALTEWLHDRCGACRGTGSVGRQLKMVGRNHPALYTCTTCGGSGAYEPGNQQRAQALRMDVETFMKKWERRYEGVLATLQRTDRKTGVAIDRQARGLYAVATDRSREQ